MKKYHKGVVRDTSKDQGNTDLETARRAAKNEHNRHVWKKKKK